MVGIWWKPQEVLSYYAGCIIEFLLWNLFDELPGHIMISHMHLWHPNIP